VAASASGFAQLVVENPQQPPTPAPANERELGAILVEMKGARIRIGVNAPSALIAATLKALCQRRRNSRPMGRRDSRPCQARWLGRPRAKRALMAP